VQFSGDALSFYNGFGGFSPDGKEYVVTLDEGKTPPAPWINVISNPTFGFAVSETGAGSTWAGNSRENKITPWSNDPVTDRAGEAIYIKDEASRSVITPMSLGRRDRGAYTVHHGFGYTRFEHEEEGLKQSLKVFTPLDEPLKIWALDITNVSGRERALSITYYVEWVLGVQKRLTNPYIVTEYNNRHEYMSAENVYNPDYREYRAFMFSSEAVAGYTGEKQDVLGRGGSVQYPLGLDTELTFTTGVGLDACGALQVAVRLAAGETRQVIFGLGYCDDADVAEHYCAKYRRKNMVGEELERVSAYWGETLGTVQVETHDKAIDFMLNGWLMYQNISCRMYSRAAFYQCGGAYGYRDQLQDVLALLLAQPQMARDQILIAASRQFPQGDVQHWWHPPTGVGVRTKISDDLLWLPYVTAAYIEATGDTGVLSEETPYIEGPGLSDMQHDMMFVPEISLEKDTLYEHCKKAILKTGFGENGLPLMGGGDWNDGMDRVGIQGKGESVWLAWFLYAVIDCFIPLSRLMGDNSFADEMHVLKETLKANINKNAWDGEWFLRAFYDDGTKLGSSENNECRIDSISQSWSIISGAGQKDKQLKAFDSAYKYLVLEDEGVSLLLTPPFDKTPKNPGYIKDYAPGVRENGGQYTHGAIWLAIAAALLNDTKRAYALFSMLNPINHTSSRKGAMLYEKEPYVMAGDVSYMAPYTGRGGWSWYTGSAAWLYTGMLRYLLGMHKEGDTLIVAPRVPDNFGDYTIKYRYRSTLYILDVKISRRDAADIEVTRILLRDDGGEHHITVEA
jgi:cellobiose phosphorylase